MSNEYITMFIFSMQTPTQSTLAPKVLKRPLEIYWVLEDFSVF